MPSTGTSGSTMAPKKKGGLEKGSTGMTGGGGSATEKMTQTGKNIKETVGEKMGQVKDAMSMNK